MVYETSRISLEQIDELYERVDRAWNSKRFQPSWSFQDIQEETETGVSGVSLADREEARRRANTTTTISSEGGESGVTTDVISPSVSNSNSMTPPKETAEDKIVASLGNVNFEF